MLHVNDLLPELLELIIERVGLREVGRCFLVCRHWHDLLLRPGCLVWPRLHFSLGLKRPKYFSDDWRSACYLALRSAEGCCFAPDFPPYPALPSKHLLGSAFLAQHRSRFLSAMKVWGVLFSSVMGISEEELICIETFCRTMQIESYKVCARRQLPTAESASFSFDLHVLASFETSTHVYAINSVYGIYSRDLARREILAGASLRLERAELTWREKRAGLCSPFCFPYQADVVTLFDSQFNCSISQTHPGLVAYQPIARMLGPSPLRDALFQGLVAYRPPAGADPAYARLLDRFLHRFFVALILFLEPNDVCGIDFSAATRLVHRLPQSFDHGADPVPDEGVYWAMVTYLYLD